MQKILSVTLIVVMLAALITVFPASAGVAVTLPELLITELVVDTGGWSQSGSDGGDAYEFIEVVNTSDSTINLYEWSLVYANATLGADPADETIIKVNPMQSPGDSPNDFGTIGTSAQTGNDPSMYVTNPAEASLARVRLRLSGFIPLMRIAQPNMPKGRPLHLTSSKNTIA